MKNIVVLISGYGSNLQAILQYFANSKDAKVVAVFADKKEAYGLKRAKHFAIEANFVDPKSFNSRLEFDLDLARQIEIYHADIVVLAGFMRILSKPFVQKFQGKLINIHPSLLPKYQGLNTHQRVLEAKEKQHGCSVHFVTEELDAGAVILQAKISIDANDSAEILANKVLQQEHKIYPIVIEWLAQDRVKFQNHKAWFDGVEIAPEGISKIQEEITS